MKRTLLFLLFICLQSLSAQDFWQQLPTPFTGDVLCLVRGDGGAVYAGTRANGVFRSTDNGNHWQFLGLSDYPVLTIAVRGTNTIYAYQDQGGMQRSTDAGTTWTAANSGLGSNLVYKVVCDSHGSLYAATDVGLFKSGDGGGSWVLSNNGLTSPRLTDIAVAPRDFLYAASFRGGVFVSIDNAGSWTQINSGLTTGSMRSIIADPSENVYAGTENSGLFVTTDYGFSWLQIIPDGMWINLALNKHGNLFALDNFNVIYFTSDIGMTWMSVGSESLGTTIGTIAVNDTGSIFIGTDGFGLYRATSRDGGWSKVGLPGISTTGFVQGTNGVFLMTTVNGYLKGGGCFKSTNHGTSWLPTLLTGARIGSLMKQPNGTMFAASLDGLYRSTDNGTHWIRLTVRIGAEQFHAIDGQSDGTLYAAIGAGGVYRSTDEGEVWALWGLDTNTVSKLYCDSTGSVYACTLDGLYRSTAGDSNWTYLPVDSSSGIPFAIIRFDSRLIIGMTGGLYYSDDDGVTWNQSLASSIAGTARCFIHHHPRDLYAGTSKGVLKSTDHGTTWLRMNAGLQSPSCAALGIDDGGYLYAGTTDAGVYRSIQHLTGVHDNTDGRPEGFVLAQNYPNPFNPSTLIRYSIPNNGHVTLKVYDLLGREIQTLVNRLEAAGEHAAEFAASGLASGVYFYTVTAGNYRDTKKLLLLR